jgi:hypothetical protein
MKEVIDFDSIKGLFHPSDVRMNRVSDEVERAVYAAACDKTFGTYVCGWGCAEEISAGLRRLPDMGIRVRGKIILEFDYREKKNEEKSNNTKANKRV